MTGCHLNRTGRGPKTTHVSHENNSSDAHTHHHLHIHSFSRRRRCSGYIITPLTWPPSCKHPPHPPLHSCSHITRSNRIKKCLRIVFSLLVWRLSSWVRRAAMLDRLLAVSAGAQAYRIAPAALIAKYATSFFNESFSEL